MSFSPAPMLECERKRSIIPANIKDICDKPIHVEEQKARYLFDLVDRRSFNLTKDK